MSIGILNPLLCGNFTCLLEVIINFISMVAFAAAPIMILIAAFYFITSGGNPEKVRTAKMIILNTVIGLAVILLSRVFVAFFKSIF